MIDRRSRMEQSRSRHRRRSVWARIVIALLVLVLGGGLLRVQVLNGDRYALMARENRMRPIIVRAPRGTIYDRDGQVVAENIVGYRILLMPTAMDSLRAQVARLKPILGMSDSAVAVAFRRYRRAPHYPMVVMEDAPPNAVARLEERRFQFPSVLIHEYPKRHYPAGAAVAQLVGYVSEISESDLRNPAFAGYQQGRWVGKAGLEREYEKTLGGEPGVRYLEVDASGHIKQWLPEDVGEAPVPGHDLQLYLDLDLQKYIAEIFPKDLNGAIVAIDPRTGGILAYYSHPGFNPNAFVGGVSPSYWNRLNADSAKPLLDRAGGAGQPPGSTWKLAVAAMALDLHAIRPNEVMPIPCTGGMWYGGRYARCWDAAGHGYQDLIQGIKNSCDVYFYQVGLRIGLERYMKTGVRFGFTQKTHVDLPTEIAPTFPPDDTYYRKHFGYSPRENEVLSLAIGQGPIIMTPLKMAEIYVALARNDGIAPAPRFVENSGLPRDTFRMRLTPRDEWYLRAGMRRVLAPGGTAYLSRLRHWDIMGKTGTAQNPNGADHAWFAAIGGPPGGPPQIVVVAFLAHGVHGATASGYAAEAINFYLNREYGKPFEMWGTPRLRMQHGLPVDWAALRRPVKDPPMPPAVAADDAPLDPAVVLPASSQPHARSGPVGMRARTGGGGGPGGGARGRATQRADAPGHPPAGRP